MQGVGGGWAFQEVPPPLMENVLEVKNLWPMTLRSIILARVGRGP